MIASAQAPSPGWLRERPARIALLAALLASLLVLRLATLGTYPLIDTSEARYGEIARVMLATGNWVTPQEVPGTPFWAKPPLYAWLSAASMALFGVGEFALRLPSLLCAIGVAALCIPWARSHAATLGPPAASEAALIAAALLSTSALFFVSSGAVMTDPALALCVTAMLAAFHHAVIAGRGTAIARYGFFVAAGLGMLAKGPVVFLYAGVPIALWTFWQRRLRDAWTALPWIAGTLLAAVICVPWYALAESRTPGFVAYFLIGEHVMRFLHPGWSGDLYGNAHSEPTGTIWVYLLEALGATAPLLLAAVAASARRRPGAGWRTALREADPAHGFLLLSTLVPLVFFTFAGNIIWTYVLPALGPLTILLGVFCARRIDDRRWRGGLWASLALGWLALNVAWIAWVPAHSAARSGAALAQSWREHASTDPGPLLYWGRKTPASVRFYARGEVRLVSELAPELTRLEHGQRVYVIVEPDRVESLQSVVRGVGGRLRVETISVGRRQELLEVQRE